MNRIPLLLPLVGLLCCAAGCPSLVDPGPDAVYPCLSNDDCGSGYECLGLYPLRDPSGPSLPLGPPSATAQRYLLRLSDGQLRPVEADYCDQACLDQICGDKFDTCVELHLWNQKLFLRYCVDYASSQECQFDYGALPARISSGSEHYCPSNADGPLQLCAGRVADTTGMPMSDDPRCIPYPTGDAPTFTDYDAATNHCKNQSPAQETAQVLDFTWIDDLITPVYVCIPSPLT